MKVYHVECRRSGTIDQLGVFDELSDAMAAAEKANGTKSCFPDWRGPFEDMFQENSQRWEAVNKGSNPFPWYAITEWTLGLAGRSHFDR